jgi:hypothetical protein
MLHSTSHPMLCFLCYATLYAALAMKAAMSIQSAISHLMPEFKNRNAYPFLSFKHSCADAGAVFLLLIQSSKGINASPSPIQSTNPTPPQPPSPKSPPALSTPYFLPSKGLRYPKPRSNPCPYNSHIPFHPSLTRHTHLYLPFPFLPS